MKCYRGETKARSDFISILIQILRYCYSEFSKGVTPKYMQIDHLKNIRKTCMNASMHLVVKQLNINIQF